MKPTIDLFERFVSFRALRIAALQAAKGKRKKPGCTAFLANLEGECLKLERELLSDTWRPGGYVAFEITDPKRRMVSAAPFRDRVVHHALIKVIEPICERSFIFDSYANRKGKGTHRAIDRYEQFRDRFAHVLRCDIFRYFPAIDHEILKSDLRRWIGCDQTLRICDRIIDGSNAQEPVQLWFPGDELFAPIQRRGGLPIGNLTSQFFANIYLNPLDHFIKEVLRAKGYVRYVDDFALFHNDPAVIADWRTRIEAFLTGRRLKLHPKKTFIEKTSKPLPFLGIELVAAGWRRLPDENVRRFRGRLRSMRDRVRVGTMTIDDADQRIGSWIAHAKHADTWRLRHSIFCGGTFDPARKPARPLAPTASFVAVPGTTIRGTSALRTATGTIQRIGTTTLDSASPVRSKARVEVSTVISGEQASVQGRP